MNSSFSSTWQATVDETVVETVVGVGSGVVSGWEGSRRNMSGVRDDKTKLGDKAISSSSDCSAESKICNLTYSFEKKLLIIFLTSFLNAPGNPYSENLHPVLFGGFTVAAECHPYVLGQLLIFRSSHPARFSEYWYKIQRPLLVNRMSSSPPGATLRSLNRPFKQLSGWYSPSKCVPVRFM